MGMKTNVEPHTKEVNVADVRWDGTQSRFGIDPATVQRYRAAYEDEQPMPLPVVFWEESRGGYWGGDGQHRMLAWGVELGHKTMIVECRNGTKRDAYLHNLTANSAHGLPLSREERRAAVETMIRDKVWGAWSNKHIAAHIGVSDQLVASVRKEVEGATSRPVIEVEHNGTTFTRKTAGHSEAGKARAAANAERRRKAVEQTLFCPHCHRPFKLREVRK